MSQSVLLVLVLSAGAAQAAAPSAPQQVDGSYDPDTEILRITWQPPAGNTQDPVDGYTLYLNGAFLDETTSLSYSIDLSAWEYGVNVYTVKAARGNDESPPGGAVSIAKFPPQAPPFLECPPMGTVIFGHFPFADVNLYEECLPA